LVLRREGRLANALTIDVEDYFQVSALAPYIPREAWASTECRVEDNVARILAMLSDAGVHATFFTLGWVAERYPGVVRSIVGGGHELASHGYGHLRASDQSPAEFLEDIRRAKSLLEDLGGVPVQGYRAPSFSIGAGNLWALDSLLEAGYRYSSSIYPVVHDHYGMPEAPRFPFEARPGLLEIPPSTVAWMGRNWPASGGGWFRLLPYAVSRGLIQRVNAGEGQSAMFYFHPWEIDPGQPRVPGVSLKTKFRHYVNLEAMESKLRRLLGDFAWDRVDRVFLESEPCK